MSRPPVESGAVAADRWATDQAAFACLVEAHRRELRVHCYRMLGSFVESEDLVQETFLRAWRRRHSFEGRSSVRAWLYRIATNACLDTLAKRPRRILPHEAGPPADPRSPLTPRQGEAAWLEPYPDDLLAEPTSAGDDPDAVVVAKETIELAFLAVIQHLSPKQRAVLILRDVVGWSAKETAEALDDSVTAVKSALQRARATIKRELPAEREEWQAGAAENEDERAVLQRYMEAHERDDTHALAAVLKEDVRVSYAPLGIWSDGRDDFIEASSKHALPGEYKFVPTRANRQPATAIYIRGPGEERFSLLAFEVLRVQDGAVAEIVDYSEPKLLEALDLSREPPELARGVSGHGRGRV